MHPVRRLKVVSRISPLYILSRHMATSSTLEDTFTVAFEGMRSPADPPSENLTLTKRDRYGYFPATLNQSLAHGRYNIVRKLGWGTAASVWLASDNQFVLLRANVKAQTQTHFLLGLSPTLLSKF